MPEVLTATEVEARAKAAGLSIRDVCTKSGIAYSTFTRWRTGSTEPSLPVYRRIIGALSEGPATTPAASA